MLKSSIARVRAQEDKLRAQEQSHKKRKREGKDAAVDEKSWEMKKSIVTRRGTRVSGTHGKIKQKTEGLAKKLKDDHGHLKETEGWLKRYVTKFKYVQGESPLC